MFDLDPAPEPDVDAEADAEAEADDADPDAEEDDPPLLVLASLPVNAPSAILLLTTGAELESELTYHF